MAGEFYKDAVASDARSEALSRVIDSDGVLASVSLSELDSPGNIDLEVAHAIATSVETNTPVSYERCMELRKQFIGF